MLSAMDNPEAAEATGRAGRTQNHKPPPVCSARHLRGGLLLEACPHTTNRAGPNVVSCHVKRNQRDECQEMSGSQSGQVATLLQ
jgi:hypothetical protein